MRHGRLDRYAHQSESPLAIPVVVLGGSQDARVLSYKASGHELDCAGRPSRAGLPGTKGLHLAPHSDASMAPPSGCVSLDELDAWKELVCLCGPDPLLVVCAAICRALIGVG